MISRTARTAALLVLCAALPGAPADAVKRRAFVTSVSGSGDLGSWPDAGSATGLAAGDAICRARAAAGGLPNATSYRAWLSSSLTDAYCHVRGLTGKKPSNCSGGTPVASGPWYLFNGASNFTAALDDLVNSPWEIYRPVLFDELGNLLPSDEDGRSYWTGTNSNGTLHSPFSPTPCADWLVGSDDESAAIGDGYSTSRRWSSTGFVPQCDASYRLLCLEPGTSEESPLGWSPGALVFLTSTTGSGELSTWPEASGASGLAAGDAICQARAAAAHLPAPESFVAWLSTATADAKDRLETDGPFRRPDAYAIANSVTDLVDGSVAASLHVDEESRYVQSALLVHTGTLADGTHSGLDCSGWTDAGISSDGTAGRFETARLPVWSEFALAHGCNGSGHLYCFSNRIVLFWDGFELTGDTSRWSTVAP